MIQDGMSDMGKSLPVADDLEVNVQQVIEHLNVQAASVLSIPAVTIDMRGVQLDSIPGAELTDIPAGAKVLDLDAVRARRGTTNRNDRGNAKDRERRRAWLIETYRADCDVQTIYGQVDLYGGPAPFGMGAPACRCYRCGTLLTVDIVTVDRIIPGCKGGTYRRNNIRPACAPCNSITGSTTRS